MSTLINQHINNPITNHPYNYSDRQDCRVMIEVMDKGHSGKRRAGIYAIAVPYNRFSQTLRSIQCAGDQVCHVSISQLQLDGEQAAPTAKPVLEIANESISFSASENLCELESRVGEIIDSETFEAHFEEPVAVLTINDSPIVESIAASDVEDVVLAINDSPIIESIAASDVENMVSSELCEPLEAADINISEEPLIVSSADSHLFVEVSQEQIADAVVEDAVVNIEITTPPSKAKKTKASTKTAAGGFNKPKSDKITTKSPRKPKN